MSGRFCYLVVEVYFTKWNSKSRKNAYPQVKLPDKSKIHESGEKNVMDTYIENKMILLPSGEETIRKFRDTDKWISSDYRMAMPGKKSNLSEYSETQTVKPFYMMQIPVTTSLYDAIMYNQDFKEEKNKPAVNVSWYDAIKFCNLLSVRMGVSSCYQLGDSPDAVSCDWEGNGFRLASEAEWQYACRAGTREYRYGELDAIAWYEGNSEGRVHPVGKKSPNTWGLYDMIGNVWEWCWDLYDKERYGSYRVFRGGSFSDEGRLCGATCRRRSMPSFQIEDLGFRIVRTA